MHTSSCDPAVTLESVEIELGGKSAQCCVIIDSGGWGGGGGGGGSGSGGGGWRRLMFIEAYACT